ncbi:MAG: ABC transporter ATP-binding protein [Bacteroidota bacterium]
MIVVSDIYKSYQELKVLNGVSLSVEKSEIVAIVGASGAGKSTLLHIIGTLDKPDQGKISLNGTDPFSLSQKKLSQFRNNSIGFVFQFHHLLPEFTALENVMIPAMIAGISKKESAKKAEILLTQLNLSSRLTHKPSALSGGEQQRVAVARALVNNPAVILADEPSGNLDSKAAEDLHKLFFELRDQMGQTFIIVTHNSELAAMSDRRMMMQDGMMLHA